MTRLVHRRQIRANADEPRGPGATIGPILAPLSWFGWLSIVATVVYVWLELAQRQVISADDINWVVALDVLASGCLVLLPAALELGYPGVRRRNRALLMGVTMLAFVEASRPVASWLYQWATDLVAPSLDATSGEAPSFDPSAALQFAYQLMGVARQIIGLAGWLSIVSGLAAAGARPRRPLLVVAIVALTAPTAVMGLDSFLTVLANPDVLWDLVAPLPIAGVLLVIGIAGSAARAAAIVALVVGARHGLRPRLAWRLGVAAAGALVLGVVLGLVPWLPVWQSAAQGGMSIPLYVASTVLDIAFRALLLGACFAGLGRGTDERHVAMWRVFWVWGERRFRPAA